MKILIAMGRDFYSNGFNELFRDKTGIPVCNVINCSYHSMMESSIPEPDIALIDLNSKRINDKEAQWRILRHFPNTKLVRLHLFADKLFFNEVSDAGLRGHSLPGSKLQQFIDNIKAITILDEQPKVKNQYFSDDTDVHISKREMEVLRLIAEGQTNPEIAIALNIHQETAKGYRKILLEKLEVRNTAELISKSMRHGIIY